MDVGAGHGEPVQVNPDSYQLSVHGLQPLPCTIEPRRKGGLSPPRNDNWAVKQPSLAACAYQFLSSPSQRGHAGRFVVHDEIGVRPKLAVLID